MTKLHHCYDKKKKASPSGKKLTVNKVVAQLFYSMKSLHSGDHRKSLHLNKVEFYHASTIDFKLRKHIFKEGFICTPLSSSLPGLIRSHPSSTQGYEEHHTWGLQIILQGHLAISECIIISKKKNAHRSQKTSSEPQAL